MKTLLLSTTALLGLTAGALAADLPRRAAPPVYVPPPPAFTWTGFYVGANAGYGFGTGRATSFGVSNNGVANGPGTFVPFSVRSDPQGFVGGAQTGFNYQLTPGSGFVVGVEADIQGSTMNRVTTVDTSGFALVGGGVAAPGTSVTFDHRIDYLGTIRGRLGYAFNRFLVYGTGGFAYGGVRLNVISRNPGVVDFNALDDITRGGFAAGGGIEYAFTNNFSAKVEGLYFDLGQRTLTAGSTAGNFAGFRFGGTVETRGALVRGGLNFKFTSY